MHINNGHVTGRKVGDGPSKAVLDTLRSDPESLNDHLGYLTRTADGKTLKSSTIYIRSEDGASIDYLFSINYDITGLLMATRSVRALTDTESQDEEKQPEQIVHNVNDLLDTLLAQSVAMVGKPADKMNKEEKVAAIRFLNEAGAFLITRSGDKVSKYFGISKFTLYSYIDVNNRKAKEDN